MHVVICIVSYRSLRDIERCLAALSRSEHREFSVVICENGGRAAAEALGALPQHLPDGQSVKVVVAEGNLGYAGGVNLGVSRSTAESVIVMNPDVLVLPGCVSTLLGRLRAGDVRELDRVARRLREDPHGLPEAVP